ncbi:hypothetical protein [Streptomyces sp. C1-2]|uniref:hypothetical protein n=1 Tax=Streptomyces sp. C1-2 TaxID=2720022 RepID=UPI003211CC6E
MIPLPFDPDDIDPEDVELTDEDLATLDDLEDLSAADPVAGYARPATRAPRKRYGWHRIDTLPPL